ncbi:MAG TPA: restriction endonuclease, partial [Polyangia bacterium]
EEILRQLGALGIGHEYSYYRTGAGAEVDLVLEGDFGRVAVEIKHTSFVNSRDLRGLRDFVVEHKARLGLVITNDKSARMLDDKLLGLPFTWL